MELTPGHETQPLVRSHDRTSAFDHKLDQILGAAARVMAREGYGQSTIRKVAREADMSLAGLYHYFSSKEELLYLIQYHTFDSILKRLKEQLEPGQASKDGLRLMITNHLEHFLARMNELKVCASEMETLTGDYYEAVRGLRQEYLRVTLGIVEGISVSAGGSLVNPWLSTLYLFGMLNWIYMWYPAAEGMSADTLADQVLTLFLEGFLPREQSHPKK
jgi:AcrR family transcriptional regulator